MSGRNSSHPWSNILILGSNSVHSLLPSTLVSQAEALLDAHRTEDAVRAADQYRRKLQSKQSIAPDEADELRYICQRIGFHCLKETLFDDAGRHLFDGDLDPRALLSYFPELYGSLFTPGDSVNVYMGVADCMPAEDSIDEIIAANLVLNYSPHLSPNTRTALPATELRDILKLTATEMLKQFLRKWRQRLKMQGPSQEGPTMLIVETVLARLHSNAQELSDLYALLEQPNFILLEEIEPVLIQAGQTNALLTLYKQRGDDSKVLEVLSRLVTGEWIDGEVGDPLSEMFALLTEKRNRALIQQWGVWLTNRDPERALKLLTSSTSNRRGTKAEDDQVILKQLQETNPTAAAQFLEHLVLSKRNSNPDLHMQLAQSCIEQLLACSSSEAVSKLWRAKAASYGAGRSDTSFFSYFASTTPDSPSKHTRLKAMLFLQSSSLYDPQKILAALKPHENVFGLELAIVEGKCGHDRAALTTLVHSLHDFVSAEAYCTLGGEVIPAKAAQALGERFNLQPWTALFVSVAPPGAAVVLKRQRTVDDCRKRELAKILLEVCMDAGEEIAAQTARLINSQSMNLEILDVLALLPPSWPLHLLQGFLSRSFRRTLHARHEGQLVKAISSSQNLETFERTWLVLREGGAIVEEAVDDEGGEKAIGEKMSVLGLDISVQPSVAEVSISIDEKAVLREYAGGAIEANGQGTP